MRQAIAYVDGSFNKKDKVYGSGVVFMHPDGKRENFSFSGNDPELAKMYQIAGEINAAKFAIDHAVDCGYGEICIYYDYAGIEKWATGAWRAKKAFTEAYQRFIAERRAHIDISFRKVAAHTGVSDNENADRLAKAACGMLDDDAHAADNSSEKEIPYASIRPECLNGILRIRKSSNPTFRDYAELKTGGRDEFSVMKEGALRERLTAQEFEYVSDNLADDTMRLAAMRWIVRGLTAAQAVRKANVDAEMRENRRR